MSLGATSELHNRSSLTRRRITLHTPTQSIFILGFPCKTSQYEEHAPKRDSKTTLTQPNDICYHVDPLRATRSRSTTTFAIHPLRYV
ncbi:hypothetical protein BS47DRAFT_1352172 [Hydnum rufescens UP504]|uniref:Uncharacterized protein n=1 Tax=Hydnum rufescens UP504 TaxID=1448309 RepID=A0A9P6AJM2_9AGAM|nr:hypothetical protein BS47DRAFT_1352172 [Hydnum rufescens UP504]